MIKRSAINELVFWKNKDRRKPLLVRGARQVGKTHLIREFAKQFDHCIEINLEHELDFHKIFENNFGNPELIVSQIEVLKQQKIIEGKTLLFIDEIQSKKEALMALRYFYEKKPNLHVIAAGSLIEFILETISFPVGRIEYFFLFPLNFREFLLAHGETLLSDLTLSQLTPVLHQRFLQYLNLYCFLGGMPEVVDEYVRTKNLLECENIQTTIINSYRDDFSKYASQKGVPYLKLVYDSVPKLLSQKFKYTNVTGEVESKFLSKALELLVMSGLVYKCYHSSGNGVPLAGEVNPKKFKVFFVDIGLALNVLGIKIQNMPRLELKELINRGGVAEQFMAQQIVSFTPKNTHPELFYWHREEKSSSSEVDFLIAHGAHVIPVEVKSGVGKGKKSLKIFMQEKKSQQGFFSSIDEDFKVIDNVHFVPLYFLALKSRVFVD